MATTTPEPEAARARPIVDPQGRRIDYLRVSVTDRCNYRCTYCMPEDGVEHVARADVLSFEELAALISCFAEMGVTRVRLTGGEPTVRRDLPLLVRLIAAVPGIADISLSTNAHLLAPIAGTLRDAGVTRLNISLDTLDPVRFARITRRGELSRVLEGIEAAVAAGFRSVKLNTVAIAGFNDDQVGALCTFAWDRGLLPRFIEQMPMAEGATFVPGGLMSAAEIRAAVAAAFPGAALVADDATGVPGAGPARYWRVDGGSGAEPRRFGIISAMTEHFCDACNRVRLSAAGQLHTCLAYDDATDLRTVLRTGGPAAVKIAIREAVSVKRPGHSFGLLGIGGPRKAMIQIGG